MNLLYEGEIENIFEIYFNDGSKCNFLEFTEEREKIIEEQMKRPQNKRLYLFGIEFSEVKLVVRK